MIELVVKDIIKSDRATDDKQGDVLYKEIIKEINETKEQICIDFKGLRLLTTAFLNNGIGKMYKSYDRRELKKRILVKNISDKNDLKLLQLVIVNALGLRNH